MFSRSKTFLKASLRLKLSWKECHGVCGCRAQVTRLPDMMDGPWAERGGPSSLLCVRPALARGRRSRGENALHHRARHPVMVTNAFSGRRVSRVGVREEHGSQRLGGHHAGLPFHCSRGFPQAKQSWAPFPLGQRVCLSVEAFVYLFIFRARGRER